MGVHPIVNDCLERHRGLAAVWELRERGATPDQIRHAATQLRCVHDGVFLSGHAPITDWQRWKAATLTAPGTWLDGWSAGAFYGMRRTDRWPTTVKRVGDGGPRLLRPRRGTLGSLKVSYGQDLERDGCVVDDIPALLPARVLLDLSAQVTRRTAQRYMREALRTRAVCPIDLHVQIARHPGRRGMVGFREDAALYGKLGLSRGRSDAETLALALLAGAGADLPQLNVLVAGVEADLVRPDDRLIVELDGPQYHQFLGEDARKQAVWEQAGWVVRRLPTDDVYDAPHRLLDAVTAPVTEEERATAAATCCSADVLTRLEAAHAAPTVRTVGS